ncbi:LysR family transcriptional regulator [Pseudomonas sp. Leaf127]|uniref:LysR family transcriptional regulator n=1 Tax=Pseudomonas TaxID=286 RepID=UPI000703AEBE|nr:MULTISPECIES: LysR family transcriptional regulator [Pseudomonas]KQQ57231.1 LysR family transcriptional regulator [Pseudomonas sp. Leaf127]
MLNSNALRKLDMQDLMVFVSVYEQRNLTLVSEALHVSQSTVSYCLKKMRAQFDDDLFISTRNGMHPTRKAVAMLSHVQQILHQVNLCHDGLMTFDPRQQAITFNLCAPEYFELLVLPHLMRGFDEAGFAVTVNVHKLDRDLPADALQDGRYDLALCFGPGFHRLPAGLCSQVLLEDDLVGVMDRQSLPVDARLELEAYAARRHVYPTPWTSDNNMVDGWLRQQGLTREIAVRSNSYRAALQLLEGSDCVLALPRRIEALLGNEPWLGVCELPSQLPGFTLDMIWSEQAERLEANGWLREQVVKVCAARGLL